MIIQINWCNTAFARQYAETLYLHYDTGLPTDAQIQEFITEYFGFPVDYITLTGGGYSSDDLVMNFAGRKVATIWPVFCSYDENKKIISPEFLTLNDHKSMRIRGLPSN